MLGRFFQNDGFALLDRHRHRLLRRTGERKDEHSGDDNPKPANDAQNCEHTENLYALFVPSRFKLGLCPEARQFASCCIRIGHYSIDFVAGISQPVALNQNAQCRSGMIQNLSFPIRIGRRSVRRVI